MQVTYKEFFAAFGYTEKDKLFLRRFHDKDKTKPSHNMSCNYTQIETLVQNMKRFNDEGYAIFFVVNGGGHKDSDVKIARAQFIDMDDYSFEEQWRRVNEFPLEPSIIIKTNKSLHCYWLLREGNINLFRDIQCRLIERFGSDSSIKNESRVMRLHGFLHQKGEPVEVTLEKFDPHIKYTQQQLLEVLPQIYTPEKKSRTKTNLDETCEYRTNQLVSMIGSMRNKDLDNDSIIIAIKARNEMFKNPLTAHELEKEVFPALSRNWEVTKPYNTVVDNGKIRPVKEKKKLNYQTAKKLLESDLPPVEFIVDTIIAKGLVVLSAKSKLGKSWFALQLAVAVSSGKKFIGFDTKQGDVLYIDLENAPQVARSRLITVLNGAEPPDGLVLINDYSTMNDTFIEDLSEYLEEHKNTSLVIVDVFQRIKKQKKANQSDYEDIYQSFTPLKELASKYGISLVLIMHDRKMNDPTDPFNNVLGSTAIMGASDQMLVIQKKERKSVEATLSITGRTVQENEYTLKFNKPLWSMLGDAEAIAEERRREEYENNPLAKTIRKLVNGNSGKYIGTTTEIIEASKLMQGCRIYDNATKCGMNIKKIVPLLEQYDAIEHFTAPNGNASSRHEFRKIFV